MRILYDNFGSEIFDIKIGNIVETHSLETTNDVYQILAEAKKDHYACLIVKIRTCNSLLKEVFQEYGFAEINTQITYKLSAEMYHEVCSVIRTFTFREAKQRDIQKVADIAASSFKLDHFHLDKNFHPSKCDFFYKQWAVNSCEGFADKVFVISDRQHTDKVYAFITLHFDNQESARVGLAAVCKEERNKGIFTNLISNTLNWCKNNNIKTLYYGTQGNNIPIIKTMTKLYGNIVYEDYVMHLFRAESSL